MTTKHTPGPWAFEKVMIRVYLADNKVEPTIASVDCDNTNIEQAEADGRLIAAAPDLLKSLRNVMNAIALHGDGPDLFNVLHEAKGVIKRATEG